MLADLATLAGGLLVLVAGAHALVRGASALGLRLGLTPLVVGLTVVAFGTSAPELVVSVQSALAGAGGIAVGNVVGSNVANVGLILGLSVLIRPLAAEPSVVRRDLPVLAGATALATMVLLDRAVGRAEGAALMAGLIAYVAWSVRAARRESATSGAAVLAAPKGTAWRDVGLVAGGLAGLAVGAEVFVGGAVGLAEAAGLSNAVVGLTVVAVGTSLPELATSLVAAARRESEIALGNVVGSNIFNSLGILGAAAFVRPLAAPGLQLTDLAVMAAFAAALALMALTGRRLVRAEGAVLLAGYVAYVGALVVQHG